MANQRKKRDYTLIVGEKKKLLSYFIIKSLCNKNYFKKNRTGLFFLNQFLLLRASNTYKCSETYVPKNPCTIR